MLDPTLNTYALAVAAGSGVMAPAMHAVALAGSGYGSLPEKPWPPRLQFIANLISTAFVGFTVCWLLHKAPWFRLDLPSILIASGLTGHVLGPRAVGWLFRGAVNGAKSLPGMGKIIPDPPLEPETASTPKPIQEVPPHEPE